MSRALLTASVLGLVLAGCGGEQVAQRERTQSLRVTVRLPNDQPLPGPEDDPLPLPTGDTELELDVEALAADGSRDETFEGFARLSAVPGAVVAVIGDRASGRNVLLLKGVAEKQRVLVKNARGVTRLWAEDVGYIPADPSNSAKMPSCANGQDDDGDGLIDYPQDPGCAFANDDSETSGSYAAGVSPPIRFELPRIGDVQGRGAQGPYELESVEVATTTPKAAPAELIVTRVAADGFYVTDVTDLIGYNHIFAFTFSTPPFLRVCDRITKLSGTATEFFGFTELSFPAFERHAWVFPSELGPGDGPCKVPDPIVIPPESAADAPLLEKLESALVRVENVTVGELFGPEPVKGKFAPNSSNCDLDGSGFIDFDTPGSNEALCANACAAEPNCVEWTGYVSRGNYRVVLPGAQTIQVNTRTIPGLNPPDMRGKPIASLTGTLRNFSGGNLNWTIEARCGDDLVCDEASQKACVDGPKAPVSSQIACVSPRTSDDPNEGTN
jgi:hypothetical protein